MGNRIPLTVPALGGNEWQYLKQCLDTNWVSYRGPFVERFEKELAKQCGSAYAVVTASGTAALHLALLIAGVETDTEVLMPGITFVAPANAVRYCGAWPTLLDIRETDWQLDVAKLADFLHSACDRRDGRVFNRSTGRRVSAILPVHLLGGMCDVDAVAELACRYDLPVVEDAAECLGATYKQRQLASPCIGLEPQSRQVTTSFNGNKIVTAGGGGALLTDDARLAARAKHLSTTAKTEGIEFYHDEVGYNYRMTNIAAALGLAQLEQLDRFLAAKRHIAARYAELFQADPRIRVHPESVHARCTYWLYTIMTRGAAKPLLEKLNAAGIESRPVWTPLHRLPAFAANSYSYHCDFAETFYRHGISLPCSVGLGDADIRSVVDAVRQHA